MMVGRYPIQFLRYFPVYQISIVYETNVVMYGNLFYLGRYIIYSLNSYPPPKLIAQIMWCALRRGREGRVNKRIPRQILNQIMLCCIANYPEWGPSFVVHYNWFGQLQYGYWIANHLLCTCYSVGTYLRICSCVRWLSRYFIEFDIREFYFLILEKN